MQGGQDTRACLLHLQCLTLVCQLHLAGWCAPLSPPALPPRCPPSTTVARPPCTPTIWLPPPCRYELPWEDKSFEYPASLASPLQILIDASNGASDYGNKFGEPLVCGYTRTFGQRLPSGERREWIKPIMFRHARGRNGGD